MVFGCFRCFLDMFGLILSRGGCEIGRKPKQNAQVHLNSLQIATSDAQGAIFLHFSARTSEAFELGILTPKPCEIGENRIT